MKAHVDNIEMECSRCGETTKSVFHLIFEPEKSVYDRGAARATLVTTGDVQLFSCRDCTKLYLTLLEETEQVIQEVSKEIHTKYAMIPREQFEQFLQDLKRMQDEQNMCREIAMAFIGTAGKES